jgi:electron transport complex protein RnfE
MTSPAPATFSADVWRGIARENPVLVQMLGLCPAMAVTNTLANGLAMGAATTLVLLGSELFVSMFRKAIPGEVRITSYVLIIATFVTVVDLALAAIQPDISKALGPFMPLIVVNCMILGRQEAFSSKNTVGRSLLDALGSGFGFIIALVMMGAVREILGNGSFLGVSLFGDRFEPWLIMVLPPGGFLALGMWLLALNWWTQRRAAREGGEA